MKREKVLVYDCTLRDGVQAEGIDFSTDDKLHIAERLAHFGVQYIEGGYPASNPKDMEFFRRAAEGNLGPARIVAFGSTRRPANKARSDPGLAALLDARTPAVAVFGKAWTLHVTEVLRTSRARNLRMIEDSIRFLRDARREVIFDAEHFFDGHAEDPDYALDCLRAAEAGGADWIVLCDTCGGQLPHEICGATAAALATVNTPLGIHAHDDTGTAVASSLAAVRAGARMVHGTVNGYGERCGNANLCSILPALELKMGYRTVGRRQMKQLTEISRFVSETANLAHNSRQPYVGMSAYAHKGGMHIDAVRKTPASYEHCKPEQTGNVRRLLLSEQSGKSAILEKAAAHRLVLHKDEPEVKAVIRQLKELEFQGYQFEGGEASFELLMLKAYKRHRKLFERAGFRIISDLSADLQARSEASIKVKVGDREVHTAADGDGPVEALDRALRKALETFYPQVGSIELTDYKVRVLDAKGGTAAKVRVHIESSDGHNTWGTVGVSTNIIEASWQALVDSVEYGLLHMPKKRGQGAFGEKK